MKRLKVRNALARLTAAIGALSAAACGGQSGAIPGSSLSEPTYATQASGSLPETLQNGGVPAQAQESVLHSFADGSDAYGPFAGLTNVNGVLYGTTSKGGAHKLGTVFSLSL
jgi:uncharacterized repeat protein (TIGR03803 family)